MHPYNTSVQYGFGKVELDYNERLPNQGRDRWKMSKKHPIVFPCSAALEYFKNKIYDTQLTVY